MSDAPSWASVFLFGALYNAAVEKEYVISVILLVIAAGLYLSKGRT